METEYLKKNFLNFWGMCMSIDKCQSITYLMSGFNKTWFFAGGWAIDLFLGKETRDHHDIEIGIFREDQIELKQFLRNWEFKV